MRGRTTAYDEALAERVRDELAGEPEMSVRRILGGRAGRHRTRLRPDAAAQGLTRGSGGWEGGDRLDLDQLVGEPERGDAEQGAGGVVVAEGRPDDLPGRHEVLAA